MKIARPSVWESLNEHCVGKLYAQLGEWVKTLNIAENPTLSNPEALYTTVMFELLERHSLRQKPAPFRTSVQTWVQAHPEYNTIEIATDLARVASRIAGYKPKMKQVGPAKPVGPSFHAVRDGLGKGLPPGEPLTQFNYGNPGCQGAPLELDVQVDSGTGAMSFHVVPEDDKHQKKLAACLPNDFYGQSRWDGEVGEFEVNLGMWPKVNTIERISYTITYAYEKAKLPRPERISWNFSHPLMCRNGKLEPAREVQHLGPAFEME